MTDFTISDTHYGHKRIMEFCTASRPFASIEEMEVKLIMDWNNMVKADDNVYHLGDFAFHLKTFQIKQLFEKLNGKKTLIVGNHDHSNVRKLPWVEVTHYKELTLDDQRYVLCHYPLESWNHMHHGAIHLHGHVHSMPPHPDHAPRLSTIANRFDAGVDRQWLPGYHGPLTFDFFKSIKTTPVPSSTRQKEVA